MKKILIFVFLFFIPLAIYSADNTQKKIAAFQFTVYDPEIEISEELQEYYGNTVANSIVEFLRRENREEFVFLTRDESTVQELLTEIDFQSSGMTIEQAAEFGRQTTADYVLSGSIVFYEGVYLIKAQLVSVSNGEIIASSTATIEKLDEVMELDENGVTLQIAKELNAQVQKLNTLIAENAVFNAIATIPFTGNAIKNETTGDAFASLFINDFVNAGYAVSGRGVTVDRIFDERRHQDSGYTENAASQSETTTSTSYLLSGTVENIDESYIFSLMILDVDTGEILASLILPEIKNLEKEILTNKEKRIEIFNTLNTGLLQKKSDDTKEIATFRFAVVEPINRSNDQEQKIYGEVLADMIIQEMNSINSNEYSFLARDENVVNELIHATDFNTTGMTINQATDFGKYSTADYVLTGSVVYYDDIYLAKAQLVNVSTSEIIASSTTTLSSLEETREEEVASLLAHDLNSQVTNLNTLLAQNVDFNAIATIPFNGNAIANAATGDVISSLLINNFVDAGYVVLGSGKTINEIQNESITPNQNSFQVNKSTSTEYVLTGTIDGFLNMYIINFKILDVTTGEIIATLTLQEVANIKNQILTNEKVLNEIYIVLNSILTGIPSDRTKLDKLLKRNIDVFENSIMQTNLIENIVERERYTSMSYAQLQDKEVELRRNRSIIRVVGYATGGIVFLNGLSKLTTPERTNLSDGFIPMGVGLGIALITGIPDFVLSQSIETIEKEKGRKNNINISLGFDPVFNYNGFSMNVSTSLKISL